MPDLTDEAVVEKQIQMKGLNAPRIKPEDLDAVIVKEQYHVFEGSSLTVCVLTLKNGFTVSGESACASPENFDAEIGRQVAKRTAREKLWGLLGYELKSKLKLVEEAQGIYVGDMLFTLGTPQTYIGTKVIHALPMNRLDYNVLRGWQVPADENPNDEGYLVQYADGGDPNVPGFSGYLSWSPKEVFERSYFSLGSREPKIPPTFIDRMQEEHDQLSDKCNKAAAFFNTPIYKELDPENQKLLREQFDYMTHYLYTLGQRLKLAGR